MKKKNRREENNRLSIQNPTHKPTMHQAASGIQRRDSGSRPLGVLQLHGHRLGLLQVLHG